MSNAKTHAERELDILSKSSLDPNNRPLIEEFSKEIIDICEKFGNSGQSGGSAPYTAKALSQAIEKLCLFKPICPITGIDNEWNEVTEMNNGKKLYQNNRCSALFKDENDKSYYIDAIIFNGDKTGTFTSNFVKLNNGETIKSKQYIKSFPFIPKTFYVDVIETEWADKEEKIQKDGGGWWTSIVKDEKQLDDIFNYYEKNV